ncbi:synaptobrevin-domain-containing protein, partial [Tilletiopsis washingtonensis]
MIILALVAADGVILAEHHDEAHAPFLTAAETILARTRATPESAARASYAFEDWLFHVLTDGGVQYLCCADDGSGRRLPFAFLAEVQKKFLATFDAALLSNPLPADFASFAGTLSGLVSAFNLSPNSDPVRAAQAELGAVRDIMTQNVEQLLSRGERLDLLVDRTQDVAAQSHAFRRQATTVRRNMWWKNVKIMALAGAFLTLLVVLLVLWLHPW